MSPTVAPAHGQPIFAALLVALSGCYYVDEDDKYDEPYYDTWEIEPNDQACCPDVIGPIAVGESWIIGGTIDANGPDWFDGFAFWNAQPCDIEFFLIPERHDADLDLCVYDPQLGQYVACFQSAEVIEKGRFSVPNTGTDFHLVVSAYAHSSEYRLEIYCEPITVYGLADQPPASAKAPRAVPLERYFRAHDPLPAPEARVLARGVMLEVDPASGELRQASLELRSDGWALRPLGN